MESTPLDFRAFAFIITLAAVVNGLGIVRWLSALAEYLRQQSSLDVQRYWVYNLLVAGFVGLYAMQLGGNVTRPG